MSDPSATFFAASVVTDVGLIGTLIYLCLIIRSMIRKWEKVENDVAAILHRVREMQEDRGRT